MRIIHVDEHTKLTEPCVATIGFFDGVHRGHRFLIDHLKKTAQEDGLQSMVITFDEHPRKVLRSDYQPRLLSTLDGKLTLLSKTNIDIVAVLHFDLHLAALSAKDFMNAVLKEQLNVRKLYIGYDHRFGHNRKEGFDDYVRYGRELGMEILRSNAFILNGVNVSSSVVRSFLQDGEVEMAAQCLGYPYTLLGKVEHGQQEGRKLGYPTANINTSDYGQLIPAPGVYAVKVMLRNQMTQFHGMMNIGTRPTFEGHTLSLEVHIFNFQGNLYGQELKVSFIHRIRSEQKFSTPEALAHQLERDAKLVEEQFDKENDL